MTTPQGRGRAREAAAYAWWVLVGALATIGVLALLTVGVPLLALAAGMAWLGLSRPRLLAGIGAAPAGVGVAALYLAWLNRGGPGEVCRTTPTLQECHDAWSPWPFVVVGLLLVAAAVLLARPVGRRLA